MLFASIDLDRLLQKAIAICSTYKLSCENLSQHSIEHLSVIYMHRQYIHKKMNNKIALSIAFAIGQSHPCRQPQNLDAY